MVKAAAVRVQGQSYFCVFCSHSWAGGIVCPSCNEYKGTVNEVVPGEGEIERFYCDDYGDDQRRRS